MFERYAVYYTPAGSLATAGAAWLGWDSAAGKELPHPDIKGLDLTAITETPRKYGIHGTLKPPFFLAEGVTEEALIGEVSAMARRLRPVILDGLCVSRLGKFLALTPEGDQDALAHLAAQVVMELDHFRAPPSEAELARRRQTSLSVAQEKHLADWGYPYVLDQFRFHITLTGRLRLPENVMPHAERYFGPILPKPFILDALTLLGQSEDGRFRHISRHVCEG